jgi:Sec-independent protein translocase protein TatA
MFGIGISELVVLVGLSLVFLKPEELPKVARFCGKIIRDFKRAKNSLTASMVDELEPPQESESRVKSKVSDLR